MIACLSIPGFELKAALRKAPSLALRPAALAPEPGGEPLIGPVTAAAGSGSTSTSRGAVASASPRRIRGRTPAASAAAVTGPISGSPPGSGASAAGRSARDGAFLRAAFSSNPGMERQAIMGTCVLYEHVFPCQAVQNLLGRYRHDRCQARITSPAPM